MDLAGALLGAALTLSGVAPTPERREYLEHVTTELASASEEATCTEGWAELDFCVRAWPGPAAEAGALALMIGWYESRLDARIQRGECRIWGPLPRQIECDGVLFKGTPTVRGLTKTSPWGTVVFRSLTMFQIRDLSSARRHEVLGTAPMQLFESSREALRILSRARSACRGPSWAECTISSYAGTRSLGYSYRRAKTFRNLLRVVRAEQSK